MIRTLRSSLVVALLTSAEILFAQSAKPVDSGQTYWDSIALISKTWWFCTLLGTALFGLLIGFFVYGAVVKNGRASAATGTGCLVAVLVFLSTQLMALAILLTTVYSTSHLADKERKASDESKHTAPTGATQATTSGATSGAATTGSTTDNTGSTTGDSKGPAKPTTTTGTTSGDDF
jgi:hypothetical protein